jgi:AICAR transformylase/IMP cyclohydrolase PurH
MMIMSSNFRQRADRDKEGILEPAKQFQEKGFTLFATEGTYNFFNDYGVKS